MNNENKKIIGYDSQTGQPIYGNQSIQQINQNIQQPVVNKPTKKKKYWLMPIYVFLAMILAPIMNLTLRLVGFDSSIIASISTIIYVLCGFAFIPSIIVAIV